MKLNSIQIPASKSLSNRWLILQYLYPKLEINNLSTAKDTEVLQAALRQIVATDNPVHINIGHAGTAMRFLTALLSVLKEKTFFLDGSARMRERPIKILVDALRQIGAEITYLNNDGYPPLQIKGKELSGHKIEIAQNVSSQYISALLLIAPKLSKGLKLLLKEQQVSKPYVKMTLELLSSIGVDYVENNEVIKVYPKQNIDKLQVDVEGDWSSSSYFYAAAAVTKKKQLILTPFVADSLQGDSKIDNYFKHFGINTEFTNDRQIILRYDDNFSISDFINFDLLDTPDLAQTIAVTCLALGIKCHLTGLQTLRIKETDRLQALQTEMQKLGAEVKITDKSLEITKAEITNPDVTIETYDDHRMAMSFAVLQKLYPEIKIKNPEVVVKSFPDFWQIFKKV